MIVQPIYTDPEALRAEVRRLFRARVKAVRGEQIRRVHARRLTAGRVVAPSTQAVH